MKTITRSICGKIVVFALIFGLLVPTSLPASAQQANCSSSSPSGGEYTVTLCLQAPAVGSALVGDTLVTPSISVSGTSPGVRRVIFFLDESYLLTDYESPYSFTLPSTKWVDGSHTLSVESLMRDGFLSDQASVTVDFDNGITSPPVNTNQFQPTSGLPANGEPYIVASVGDGAGGETAAADVSNVAVSRDPNLFLYLGDVYEKGSVAEFYNWYGTDTTFFGQLRSITNPTIGNHEYENGVAPGYFDYWDNVPNYYSYDAGGWHFISLNSNSAFEPVDPQSAQYQWLQQDLAANPGACTIVYYHHPLFNIGNQGSKTSMSDIWALMSQYGVSIALTGHDHNYQRWVPLDANGQPSSTGVTEFVIGAGGHGVRPFVTSDSRVAYSNDSSPTALGVLFLQLNANGVDFSYVNIAGSVLDAGAIPCVNAGPDTQAPSPPEGLTATATSATRVDLSWAASSDDTGVSGYTVYRDGNEIASLPSSSLLYSDKTALPDTTYTYTVDAFDPAGNHSAASNPATQTTPSMPASLTFDVEADTYVNESYPDATYGTATVLRADALPDLHSFLRFTVEGLANLPIEQARLLVYANNSSSIGINLDAVADNSWSETATSYNNAPAMGDTLASSGGFTSGDWIVLDVTPYISGEGTYSFGLDTPGTTSLSFPSRESGTNAAQLIVSLQGGVDTEPPSVPGGLTANVVGPSTVDLSWDSSLDNVGVTGYTIYRDGLAIATVSETSLAYSDTTAAPATTYQYTVDAFDADGNHSAESAPVSVTTPEIPSSLTLLPVADAYVNARNSTRNYGHSSALRADGAPDVHSYIRFDVQGTGGAPVDRARLLIYANSSSVDGLDVESVSDNSWDEYTVNYENGPPLGSVLSSVPSVTGGNWYEFDVSTHVTGDGLYSFGVSTIGVTAISLGSRESGSTSPQLMVDLQSGGPDTQPPDTPTNLSGTAAGSTQVDLNWDASSDNVAVAGYTVFRDGVEIGTVADTTLSYSDISVTPSTTYQYTVDAFDAAGNHSAASSPVSVTTPSEPPTVPTGLTANVISSTQVDLSWEASTDDLAVAGYTVYRDGLALATLSDVDLSYSDTDVLSGVSYSYTVDAFDYDGNRSAMSAPVTATTPDTVPPTTPTGLTANVISSTRVDLSWEASSDNVAVAGYTVFRDGVEIGAVADTALAYSDASVTPSTTYQYSVDAFDAAGNHSTATTPVSVTMPNDPPTVPTGLIANVISSTQVDLGWNASTDDVAVTGYTIYRDGLPLTTVPDSTLSFSDSSVLPSTSYQYSVDAFDADGNHSAASPPVSVTTPNDPPTVPAGLTANVISSTQVDLTWNASTDDVAVAGYTLYRNGSTLATLTDSSLSYSDTTVLPGASYSYTIDAFDVDGNHSAESAPVNVSTPDNEAPTMPTGLTATVSGANQVDLSWNASTDNVAVTGYTIYRDGAALSTVPDMTLSFTDASVVPATSYQYSVDAFDAAGNHSAASGSVVVSTPASLTFGAQADAYVNVDHPTFNYGSSNSLRVDASPDLHSYLRFDVRGLGGKSIVQARLLIYSGSRASEGLDLWTVNDNSWDENTIDYINAPALASVLGSSGYVDHGTWVEFDVTSYVTREGAYSFGLTDPSATQVRLSSREANQNTPQLILDLQ